MPADAVPVLELMESSPDQVLALDLQGNILEANRAACEATGIPRARLRGRHFSDLFAEKESVAELLRRVLLEGRLHNFRLSYLHEGGATLEVVCSANLHRNEKGDTAGIFVVTHDASEIKRYETQVLFQANFDALTALPTRLALLDRIAETLVHTCRHDGLMAVMLIDLDYFKEINDTLGHGSGDNALKAIASRLQHSIREASMVARLGGDEFGIVMSGLADMRDTDLVAQKLLDAVSVPLMLDGEEIMMGCSMGIAMHSGGGGSAYDLLRNAETAMYRAKDAGRNRFQYFTDEMDAVRRRRVDIGNRLRYAVNNRRSEFALHFQPRVGLATGEITGVEALLRWNAKGKGPIPPGEFIPIAEKTGAIAPIGQWVLLNACQQAKQWQVELGKRVPVAVNLSARQFLDADVAQCVARVLDQTGLSPDLLELELTESMLMHHTTRVLGTLHALKDIGVRLAVDDFGTGYSSLGYLKDFPLDYLKVDRSFVADIPCDLNDKALVHAIIAMAHNLGMKVIAEGIETRDQVEFLLSQDCDEIQGFYFSKPLPVADITQMLKAGRRL